MTISVLPVKTKLNHFNLMDGALNSNSKKSLPLLHSDIRMIKLVRIKAAKSIKAVAVDNGLLTTRMVTE